MAEKEAKPNYITWEEMRNETRYIREDIQKMKKTLRLLFAHLVDKKIIGEELGKAFQETKGEMQDIEKLLEWYVSRHKLEK